MSSKVPPGMVRLFLFICFAMVVVAPAASAQNAAALTGVYNGTYRCAQGATNLKLSLTTTASGELSGLFTFYLPPGTQNQGYTYSLHGQYDARTAKFSLMPVRWETQHPANFNMVGMNGSFDSTELAGSITGPGCTTFNVERNQSESANIAAVMALQKSVAPAETGAAPAQGAYETALRAQAPASVRASLPPPAAQPQPVPAVPSRTPSPTPQQAAQQRPSSPAAPARTVNSTIKFLCFSSYPGPVVYFSDIYDLPDYGTMQDNFLRFEGSKLGFQIYLAKTYKYEPDTDAPVTCMYLNASTTPNVDAAMATRKQSLVAQAGAARKQVVETGWKYIDTPSTSASSTAGAAPPGQQTAQQRPQAPTAPKAAAPGPAQSKQDDLDARFAKALSPILGWGMKSEKDALTDEVTTKPTSTKFIPGADGKLQGYVTTSAYCTNNGVSIFFLAGAGDKDPVPGFPWYTDPSRDDDEVADVRIRVDTRAVHVAQGFPQIENRQRYTNTLGLLFYEPGTFDRAVRDQQNSVTTGIPAFDGLLGGLVRQSAQANAQAWQDSAAGPLSDLISARSIRIELPVTTFDPKPVLDLNPQDPVLHKFVSDCNAKFGSRR